MSGEWCFHMSNDDDNSPQRVPYHNSPGSVINHQLYPVKSGGFIKLNQTLRLLDSRLDRHSVRLGFEKLQYVLEVQVSILFGSCPRLLDRALPPKTAVLFAGSRRQTRL